MKKLYVAFFVILIVTWGTWGLAKYLPKERSICIQPFEGINSKYVKEVETALSSYYQCTVHVLPPVALPKGAFVNIKSPRYRADSLIRYLRKNKPKEYKYIIGLTHKDISTTKYANWKTKTIKEPVWKYKDFGIFGLGFRPGSSCVVSTFRLYSGNVSEGQMLTRLRKIACHEIGHNMGLKHCPNESCFMRDAAESIRTIDQVPENLCEDCLRKISSKHR